MTGIWPENMMGEAKLLEREDGQPMKTKIVSLLAVLALLLTACSQTSEDKNVKIGTTQGIYAQVAEKALIPALKEEGYKAELVKFGDLLEPNEQLLEGEIDANLIQQKTYLDDYNEEFGVSLTPVTDVPSVRLGLYSNSIQSAEEIPDGALITIPNDELGTARALRFLEQQGLLTLEGDAEPFAVDETQIADNPKNLIIQPVITSQLIASMASGDLAVIPDNYIMAEEMELEDALAMEELSDELQYVIAVKEEDRDSDFAAALKSAIQSDKFKKAIEEEFQGFGS